MKKGKIKKLIIGISGIVIVLGSFTAGNVLATKGITIRKINPKVQGAIKEASSTAKYKELFDVRNAILANYDGEVDDNILLEGAIKGMASSLKDPYTVYMTKDEYKSFNEDGSGEYVGIGIYIAKEKDKIVIASPIKNSPAEKAGIKSGDIIESVNGEVLNGDTEKAGKLIKGKKGETVELVLTRKGEEKPITMKVVRDEVKTECVESEMISKDIGLVQISEFKKGATEDFQKALKKLKSDGMKGLVLDLRSNPGGYLDEAVGIASQFIKKGETITYTVDKYDKKVVEKSKGGIADGLPLIVLINGGSASASEVVTGALRDYNLATIIGEKSFGKGIVQAPVEFKNGSALKVTISKYYTPNGENIHKKGIAPNIEVKIPEDVLKKPYDRKTDSQLKKAIEVMNEKIN